MRHHCFKYRIKVNMTWNLAKLPLRAQTPREFIKFHAVSSIILIDENVSGSNKEPQQNSRAARLQNDPVRPRTVLRLGPSSCRSTPQHGS